MLALAVVRVNLSTHKGDKGRPDLFTAEATYCLFIVIKLNLSVDREDSLTS